MSETRAYGTTLVAATALYLDHPKYGSPSDFADNTIWTPVAGDVKVSKDGGAAANIGTLPAWVAGVGWKYILSNIELQCKQLIARIVDQDVTKVIADDKFVIETSGNASSLWPDPADASPVPAVLSTAALASVLNGVWDLATSGHVTSGTFGAQLKTILDQVGASVPSIGAITAALGYISGTSPSAPAQPNQLVLASTAPAVNDAINGLVVMLLQGPGAPDAQVISDYVGASRTAILPANWAVPPGIGTQYVVLRS